MWILQSYAFVKVNEIEPLKIGSFTLCKSICRFLESAEEVSSRVGQYQGQNSRNVAETLEYRLPPESKDLFQTKGGGRVFMFNRFEVLVKAGCDGDIKYL